jgi:hypothetical protein
MAIFADCTDHVAPIDNVFFVHCLKDANKTAHELARKCFIDKKNCVTGMMSPLAFS